MIQDDVVGPGRPQVKPLNLHSVLDKANPRGSFADFPNVDNFASMIRPVAASNFHATLYESHAFTERKKSLLPIEESSHKGNQGFQSPFKMPNEYVITSRPET